MVPASSGSPLSYSLFPLLLQFKAHIKEIRVILWILVQSLHGSRRKNPATLILLLGKGPYGRAEGVKQTNKPISSLRSLTHTHTHTVCVYY